MEVRELWVESDGVRLFAVEEGSGPPVVMLHGGMANHLAALPFVAPLAGRRRIVAPDVRGRRGKRPVTLAYLDLDDFKAVNDALGHKGGDNLLRAVARILQSSVRSSDLAARLGGNEFAVLLTGLGPEEARQTLERLRASLTQPPTDTSSAVTVSIGAVTFMMPPDDIQAMIQMADAVLYSAKKDGKNRIHLDVIGPDMATAEARRLTGNFSGPA
jgi:diguanylate cyclase (GGDEF)-like protein